MKKLLIVTLTILLYYSAFSESKQKRDYHFRRSYMPQICVGECYDIIYHRLEWEIDPGKYYIKGCVTTFFKIKQQTDSIRFDLANELVVDSILYHNKKINFSHSNNILTLNFSNLFFVNQKDSVSIFYQGEPSENDGFGAFTQTYHNLVPIIWTLSEPYGARDWWPCKQSLTDKADSIDVFVTTPKEYKVASNGKLISEKLLGNKKITHWKHRHPIAAYLVAIAVTDYVCYSDYVILSENDSIEILNYVYPENLETAKEQTPDIIPVIELYNELFITYPFKDEKYGHAQFSWAGGMEHQTMSFVSNFSLYLMAHELAHQWFGDYITCGSWQEIWVNEGFARYCEGLVRERFNDNWLSWKTNKITNITSESNGSVFVYDTTTIYQIFNTRLTYDKAAMVLHMLRWELGDSIFFQSIKNYLTDSTLINNFAKTDDVKRHFEATADTNLSQFFNNWIYKEGYPIYNINWLQNDENIVSLNIKQTQSDPSVSFFELDLPIFFSDTNNDTLLIFHNSQASQNYLFQLPFKVKNIVFDPEKNIITTHTNIVNINSSNLNKDIFISPNPVVDFLTIKSNSTILLKQVSIYSISGRELKTFSNFSYSDSFQIDLTALKTGSYFVGIKTKKRYYAKRIFKK
ncbi:MAG: T9SS type A sorting domain-containing protein [Bacteroidetes bacterium]|nr:T9SS type A sorting domain-containing protein [Bacteroidota bacterium]